MKKGFTLIEIIVSLAIFSIVATVALGALVKVISVNRKAQTLQSALTNIDFALESMSREMRTGTKFTCKPEMFVSFPASTYIPQDCSFDSPWGGGTIVFTSARSITVGGETCNAAVAYNFSTDAANVLHIKKAEQTNCAQDAFVADDYIPIFSQDDITLKYYSVNITNTAFPLISLHLQGYAGVREMDRTYFEVQTAVSPLIP